MKFSIVIPSYLGPYPSAANNREEKLVRAISSVLNQTFQDFECLVIADGCSKTVQILNDYQYDKLFVTLIPHGKLWSGNPRNKGLELAKGEWIIYLDIDDVYGEKHLEVINNSLNGYDWVWYNDIRFHPRLEVWYENQCEIRQIGRHGTSNICHRRTLNVNWDFSGYAHDYYFTQQLLKFANFAKIITPEYYVFHVPGTRTSGGYDL